jgi:hypothetical protein
MKKSLIIKLFIAFVIVLLSYCVFWLFKIGQTEQKITTIFNDYKNTVSYDKLSNGGFPLSQKFTIENLKINIPINAISKKLILIEKLNINSSIFSSDFTAEIAGNVEVKLADNSQSFKLEFSQSPIISFSVNNSSIKNFTYTDSGFKILDSTGKVIHSSATTNITSSSESENNQISLSINLKEFTGYSFIDFYKNVFEDKIIEGIKTGEIKVNSIASIPNNIPSFGSIDPNILANLAATNPALLQQINQILAQANPNNFVEINNQVQQLLAQNNIQIPNPASINQQNIAPNNNQPTPPVVNQQNIQVPVKAYANEPNTNNQPSSPNVAVPSNPQVDMATAQPQVDNNNQPVPAVDASNIPSPVVANAPATNGAVVATDNLPVVNAANAVASNSEKMDISIEIELSNSPITIANKPQNAEVPVDPAQLEDSVEQYAQNITIKNAEFSYEKYKIIVNGKLTSLPDDPTLSGGITVKIENQSDFINAFKNQLLEYSQSSIGKENADPVIVEKYQSFLRNLNNRFYDVFNEIAAKNPATKEKTSQFDIRREKNLDFMANETSIYEILGRL